MAQELAYSLVEPVAVTDRLVAKLLESEVILERSALMEAGRSLLSDEAPLANPGIVRRAVDEIVGLGPIEDLLRDPSVTDVLVNGTGEVWIERDGRLERSDVRFDDAASLLAAIERVIAPLGLRLDLACPAVDARLADGSRLHAVIPPVAREGPIVAVRRFTAAVRDLDELISVGGVDEEGARLLREAVAARSNILVSGSTGSGKTTLLNVLSHEIPALERVVTVEDAAELQLGGHVVGLQARPPNIEGVGAVELRALVRYALRLRPDRIVVGEVRGPEALDLIQAISTGHSGSMSTVHAGSADEALWRLETLALSAADRLSERTVRNQLRAAWDLIIQVERSPSGRRVRSASEVGPSGTSEVYRCS